MEETVEKIKRFKLSQRATNWIHASAVAAAVAVAAGAHILSSDATRGFLFGNIETTLGVSLAVAVIAAVISARYSARPRETHAQSGNAGMIALLIVMVGNVPLYMSGAQIWKHEAVREAYWTGYQSSMQIGLMAEKHPELARKIATAIAMELMHGGLKDTLPQDSMDKIAKSIDTRWKDMGITRDDY